MNKSPQNKMNIATVLLHDYYHRGVFHNILSERDWHRLDTRIERQVDDLCRILEDHNVLATFFTLGWLADKNPRLIRKISECGHEIASAGYSTRSIRGMRPAEFREELRLSKTALEQAGANKILGFRCAYQWLYPDDQIHFDILKEEGYLYDASLKPRMWTPKLRDRRRLNEVIETEKAHDFNFFPVSTLSLLGFNIPVSGGNYLRQFPKFFTQWAFHHWRKTKSDPYVLYFHPWEIDEKMPRINISHPLTSIRQYRNLGKIRRLLPYYFSRGKFTSIADYLNQPLEYPEISGAAPSRIKVFPAEKSKNIREVTVIIPCYNEFSSLKYLANTLDELQEKSRDTYRWQFIFVDDCSKDDTCRQLGKFFAGRDNCRILKHKHNSGVAAGIQTGLLAAQTEIVCTIDADCTYDPLLLLQMIPLLDEGMDMVVASPYHKLGMVKNVPGWRLALSKNLSKLYHFTLNHRLSTYTAMFRVYRRSAIGDLRIRHFNFIGIVELLAKLDIAGGKIYEFPTTLQSRLLGHSKMKVLETIWGHLKLLLSVATKREQMLKDAVPPAEYETIISG